MKKLTQLGSLYHLHKWTLQVLYTVTYDQTDGQIQDKQTFIYKTDGCIQDRQTVSYGTGQTDGHIQDRQTVTYSTGQTDGHICKL